MVTRVYQHDPHSPRVQIRAELPLLRAGLERIVSKAGLRVTDPDETGDVVIRTPAGPRSDVLVDVCADESSLTLTITGIVEPANRTHILHLVAVLLGCTDSPPLASPVIQSAKTTLPMG